MDTGATHHMTGSLELLTDLCPVSPVSVKLPARENILFDKRGMFPLTSHITLRNIYYVEGFHTNLISLGQLLTDSSLVGQVTEQFLVL